LPQADATWPIKVLVVAHDFWAKDSSFPSIIYHQRPFLPRFRTFPQAPTSPLLLRFNDFSMNKMIMSVMQVRKMIVLMMQGFVCMNMNVEYFLRIPQKSGHKKFRN
jgi:hypothetical protein